MIAHELTHTLQQGAAETLSPAVQKKSGLAENGTLIQRQPDDSPNASVSYGNARVISKFWNNFLRAKGAPKVPK